MRTNIVVLAFITAMLGGCSGTRIANQDALASAAQKAAAESEVSLDQAISDATLELATARSEGLDFYAPLHIEKAGIALEEARKLRARDRKGEHAARALVEAMKVGELLSAARRNRELVEQVLASALEHRQVLLKLGTDSVLPQGFEKGIAMLGSAIRQVEHGDLEKARSIQADTIAWFNDIEGDTLRVQFLNRAKALLEKAADVDADDYAPKSWEAAENAYERADDFIETNFRDRDAVKAIASNAYNEASRAYHLAVEVKKVIGKNPDDIEQYMLGIQQLFNDINQHAGVMDLGALSFAEQSRQLSAAMRDAVSAAKAAEQVEEAVPAEESEQPAGPDVDVGTPEITSEAEIPAETESAVPVAVQSAEQPDATAETEPAAQPDSPVEETVAGTEGGRIPAELATGDSRDSAPELAVQQDADNVPGVEAGSAAKR